MMTRVRSYGLHCVQLSYKWSSWNDLENCVYVYSYLLHHTITHDVKFQTVATVTKSYAPSTKIMQHTAQYIATWKNIEYTNMSLPTWQDYLLD